MTSSDLEFNISNIDFGHCTIYEAVTKSVQLTNYSMLPQQFGFVDLPEVCFSCITTTVDSFSDLHRHANPSVSKSEYWERGQDLNI